MADLYPSMTALLAARTEGVDYTITKIENPFSPVTITAVHGGNIERGTSEVGALIREYGNYNYFSFNCLLDTNPSDLHVTSTNYDEPQVLGLMAASDYVVGIHGKSGTDESIYVGGLDSAFRNIVWTKLEEAGFTCLLAPEGIAGQEPMNITNRTRSGGGVQLETTTNLRKSFFIDGDWNNRVRANWSQKMYDFAHAVHDAIQEFLPTMSTDADTSYKMDLKEDLNYGAGAKADLKKDIDTTNQNIATNAPLWTEAYSRVQDWKGQDENGKVTINGGVIQAYSLLADRMAIGNFENAYQNGSFEMGAAGWKPASAWSIVQDGTVAATGNFYAKGVWGGASSVSYYDTKEIQVREGDKWYWEGWFRTDLATSTKTRTMLIKLIDKAGVETFVIKEETLSTTWQKFAYTFDIPVGTVKIVLGLSVKSGQPAGFATLVDNVFAKKMLTGELIVDGTISGSAIIAGTMTWDRGYGGTITLGGVSAGNGDLIVLNSNGDVVVQLNATDDGGANYYSGFQDVIAETVFASDSIKAPNIVETTTAPINLWVDPINGNDNNAGNTTWTNPLATIQEAIDRLPKVLSHDVTIQIHYNNGTEINENVMVQGFTGSGILTIDFQNTTNVVYGGFKYMYNTINCVINKGKIIATSSANPIYAEGTSRLALTNGTICDAKSLSAYPIFVSNGYADLRGAEFYNGTTAQILCGYGGRADVIDCKGSGAGWGIIAYRSALVMGTGTAPTGAGGGQQAKGTDGGIVAGTWTNGTTTTPSTPAATTYTTVKLTSSSLNAWRPNFGGQWYNQSRVLQGKYSSYGRYQGYWFFGTSFDQFNGKTITKVRIYATRYNGGGSSASQNARFVLHTYSAQPSSSSQPTYYGGINTGTQYTAGFKWGEAKWIDATAAFKNYINQSGVYGIGLWTNADSPYMIFAKNITVEVTYK